jgi:chemotaxis protein methyltransferase CheR
VIAAARVRAEVALAHVLGLRVEGSMRARLERCLREAAAAAQLGVEEFSVRLDDPTLLQVLVDRVTVQESWFFREPAHFDGLARQVLPALAGRSVTVWCAGCANGQEVYSVAMVLAESGLPGWRVLATDVSGAALARTRAGRYTESELRGLDGERRRRWLRRAGDGWEVLPELRERVDVERNNLVLDQPPVEPGGCDVVFCRNVLIYLRPEEAAAVLRRMARVLALGRHLFLASADFPGRPADGLEVVRLGEAFAYRRGDPVAVPSRPAPAATVVRRPAPAPRRSPAVRAATAAVATAPAPDIAALLDAGERAYAAADLDTAIRAFRQATCLEPDHPMAHTCLALALEAAGEGVAAARAFSAARSALARSGGGGVELGLDGFHHEELASFLATRLGTRP